ncbi:MAG TPA: hypothetical protein PKW73_13795 [Candidatus Obscuribacter sp.]|nr:hypothetical protein [Candidatus Obscuribacter sp.]HMX47013.1 hypothetical protein [Candidatus Obscuribacter sp.]HNA74413.1 hypothetical protein [Candidatus Obscuribacter sp.]HNH73091.1 hypothetical protein [Candidatus Obscuribacter sp.]
MLDVRYPIGFLFLILGALLAIYGYGHPATFNTVNGPFPLNIDVPWGIFMFLFGMGTVSLAKLDEVKKAEQEPASAAAAIEPEAPSSTSKTEPTGQEES